MKTHRTLGSLLTFALVAGLAGAADLKSGPQVKERIPGPFHPLNVTGNNAGKKHCLVCENGLKPVAMVFARECTPALTQLIKEIDKVTVDNGGKMGSFVVFLSDNEGLEAKLKDAAKENNIKATVLSIDNPAGPEKYEVARDADITVVLYREGVVKHNHAFKKGELKDKDVAEIAKAAAELPK